MNEGTLRLWLRTEAKLQGIQKSRIITIRNVPRQKIGALPGIDQAIACNSKGLRVKDKFIQIQARGRRVQREVESYQSIQDLHSLVQDSFQFAIALIANASRSFSRTSR